MVGRILCSRQNTNILSGAKVAGFKDFLQIVDYRIIMFQVSGQVGETLRFAFRSYVILTN